MDRMSQPADSVTRRIGLVLCLRVTLAPMRVSAQARVDTAEFAARCARLMVGIPDGIAVISAPKSTANGELRQLSQLRRVEAGWRTP